MGWTRGYDYLRDSQGVFSVSTDSKPNGVEHVYLFGYGDPNQHQHFLFYREEGVLRWGKTHTTIERDHHERTSICTAGAPLIARVETVPEPERGSYRARLVSLHDASTFSSPDWPARQAVRREPQYLPGVPQTPQAYDVRFVAGRDAIAAAERASKAPVSALFSPFASANSSGGLLIVPRDAPVDWLW